MDVKRAVADQQFTHSLILATATKYVSSSSAFQEQLRRNASEGYNTDFKHCPYFFPPLQVECGKGVARAIKDGLVKREELFIVSKLWNSFHDEERVMPICKKQLADWGLDYFDL